MSRKKIGLGLITLMVASIAIVLTLNQPINSIATLSEGSTQYTTKMEYTWIPVRLPATLRYADNGTLYLIIYKRAVNVTVETYGIENVTVIVTQSFSNETIRGLNVLLFEYRLVGEWNNFYYWDVSEIEKEGIGFTVYGWAKVEVCGYSKD